jgi:hypothetical protein
MMNAEFHGREQNRTPDAATRLWTAVEAAHKNFTANRRELGKLFFELKNLYSERGNSAAGRLSSGHGVFESEIKLRGYKPNRVREMIVDYEVEEKLRPPTDSTREKRKARRSNSDEYQRGYEAGYAAGLADHACSTKQLGAGTKIIEGQWIERSNAAVN